MLDTAVRPSPLVRVVMGPMTRVLNPLVKKLAGRRHFMMAAQIRHVGRRPASFLISGLSTRVIGPMATRTRGDGRTTAGVAGTSSADCAAVALGRCDPDC